MAFTSRLLLCFVFLTLCYGFIAAQDSVSSESDSGEPEEHSLILSRRKRQNSNSQGTEHHGSGHRRHHGSGHHSQGQIQGAAAQAPSQRLRRQAAPGQAQASSEEHPRHHHGSGSGHHGRKHHQDGQVAATAGQRLKRQTQTGAQQQQWQGSEHHHGGSGHHGSGHHHRGNGAQSKSVETIQQVGASQSG